nr:MAG TPA: hypothetical protein [Microviridae sp.]
MLLFLRLRISKRPRLLRPKSKYRRGRNTEILLISPCAVRGLFYMELI